MSIADNSPVATPSAPSTPSRPERLRQEHRADTVLQPGDLRGLRAYWLLFLTANVLACLPIWLVEFPPLVDYPNHLARTYILYNYNDVEVFRQRYDRAFVILPNLAIDGIVVPLQFFLPVEIAGKVFLTLVLLAFQFGCHFLGRAIHGRPTWLAFAGFFLAYHSMWLYGFVNFSFGVGIFLLTAAAWLHWRKSLRLLGGIGIAVLVCLCYLSHLAAFFFIAGTVLAVVFADWTKNPGAWRQLALQLLPLLPPLPLFFRGGNGGSGVIVWNTLQGKLIGSMSLVMSYDNRFDGAVLVLLAALLAVIAWRGRNWRVHRGVMLAAVGFFVLFLVCPLEILTGSGADSRWLAAAVPLVILAVRFQIPANLGRGLFAGFLALSLIRLTMIGADWTSASRQIAEQVAVLDSLPMGATVYPAVMLPDVANYSKRDRCCMHIVHYATIRRHAFCPSLFAYATQQPIRIKDSGRSQSNEDVALSTSLQFKNLALFDFAFCFDVDQGHAAFLNDKCSKFGEGGGSTLYRVPRELRAAPQ